MSVADCKMSEQNTLADSMLPVDSVVCVADCTMSEQNTLTDEMTPDDSILFESVDKMTL